MLSNSDGNVFVVWRPRKYSTSAGKGKSSPELKRIQTYKIQQGHHHAYESPKMKAYDAPRHKDNKVRGGPEDKLAKGGAATKGRA